MADSPIPGEPVNHPEGDAGEGRVAGGGAEVHALPGKPQGRQEEQGDHREGGLHEAREPNNPRSAQRIEILVFPGNEQATVKAGGRTFLARRNLIGWQVDEEGTSDELYSALASRVDDLAINAAKLLHELHG